MSSFSYDAIVLSGGESRRMGFPKALLKGPMGRKFIEVIIQNLRSLCPPPREIFTVLGYHREVIEREANLSGCRVVCNPDPSRGMLSSIISGIEAAGPQSSGVLVCLVDHPAVQLNTYQKVVEAAFQSPGSIVIPVYGEKGGHPVFFPREVFSDILSAPMDQGARWAVQKNRDRVIRMGTGDGGVILDVDTPEEYMGMRGEVM
jgi:CTP:molybdopterin cytidylyltransferase MocA